MVRNLTDPLDGFLMDSRCLLTDRDTKLSKVFRDLLEQSDVHCVRLSPRSPNLTPHIGRFIRSINEECFSRVIFFSEQSLRNTTREFLSHYHRECNHQSLGTMIIEPDEEFGQPRGDVRCRGPLGGMLRYYYRGAA